jgi:hypothetical protein
VSTYVITYVRRVSLLSLGCPSWYEEEKIKNKTLTKPLPRTQRKDTLLAKRLELGQKYDAWLADQVPDVKNRLKRLHVSVDHGGLRPTICCFYQGVRLFAHYVMLCFMYLNSYFIYGIACVLLNLVSMLVCIPIMYMHVCMYVCMYVSMYVCRHCTHLLFHYNYVCMYPDSSMLLPYTNYLCMYVCTYSAVFTLPPLDATHVILCHCLSLYFVVFHRIS